MIVLIAVTEKQVIITDQFNTQPIQGRMGIFQKVNAPTEMKLDIEIVGVYTEHDKAVLAGQTHAASHPGRRYITKVCRVDDAIPEPAAPLPCIKCGGTSTPGQSFCPKCQQVHLRECAATDMQPDAPNPSHQATVGPQSILLNSTPG